MACIDSGVIGIIFVLFAKRKISFIKTLNNKGPSTDPCGHLLFISFHALNVLFNFTLCFLFER